MRLRTGEGTPEGIVLWIFETCSTAERLGKGGGLWSAYVYAIYSSMMGRPT